MGDKMENRCYSRNDMMRMRDFPKSRTRPSVLSEEFNNEDGLFSPDKWLQHRWQCEGVESRPAGGSGFARKKTSSRAEEVAGHDLEAVVLSPQRRGFFSGCRAPSPKTTDDDKTTKSRWRLNNGVDFKPSFQKNLESNRGRLGNNSSVWRNNTNDRLWNDKSNRRNNNNNFEEKVERIPEWVDEGPSSMTDVIELKGFDDDVREKKSKRRRNRDSASKSGSHSNTGTMGNSTVASVGENNRQRNSYSNSTQGSRPSSRLAVAAANLPPLSNLGDKVDNDQRDDTLDNVLAAGGELSNKNAGDANMKAGGGAAAKISLPNSDAEFAALLGITDVDPTSIQKDAITMQTNQPSSSRLSRFFVKTSATSEQRPLFDNFNTITPSKSPNTPGASHCGPSVLDLAKSGAVFNRGHNHFISGDSNYPSALKELFMAVQPRPHTPTTPRDFKDGMTVEELERDLAMKMHGSSGRPLMPMPPYHHNPSFHHHSVNSPHPNAAVSAAKLAAMQAIAPPNDQFFAAFHQHMQQHFQRMGVSGTETPGMEGVGVSSSKFPFDVHHSQQQHFDGRGPNSNGSSFMPTSVLRQLSMPPAGSVNRPLFDNCNMNPPCKSPLTPSAPHCGSSVFDMAKSGAFNRSKHPTMGGDSFPSALKELFTAVPPRPHTPTTPRDFKDGMTVEELERDLAMKMHSNSGRPLMPMPPYHHNPSLHHHSVNVSHPNAAVSAAKLAAMQAIAPPNDQFFAAFHQHMHQHFQRMGVSGAETPDMEAAGVSSSSKFPFDLHNSQQQHFDGRGPNSNGSSFMPTSVLRQLSMPPAGSVNNSPFAADQQQLNLAIMRGDSEAAQQIRARMIAQVHAFAGLNQHYQE